MLLIIVHKNGIDICTSYQLFVGCLHHIQVVLLLADYYMISDRTQIFLQNRDHNYKIIVFHTDYVAITEYIYVLYITLGLFEL